MMIENRTKRPRLAGLNALALAVGLGVLKPALANASTTDADVRLKGSGTRFFTYDTTTKSFPETIDELKRRVAAAHVGDSQQQRLIDEAVLVYQNNGYAKPGTSKPK